MSSTPNHENSGKDYWQIADQIPTVHRWPESDRVPVDGSLPRHAFDFRQGVRLSIWRRLGDLLERVILRPLGKLLLLILDSRSR